MPDQHVTDALLGQAVRECQEISVEECTIEDRDALVMSVGLDGVERVHRAQLLPDALRALLRDLGVEPVETAPDPWGGVTVEEVRDVLMMAAHQYVKADVEAADILARLPSPDQEAGRGE